MTHTRPIQTEQVFRHLIQYGGLTQRSAIREYGIYRLSARIKELRDQDVPIITEYKTEKNRDGRRVRFAVYYLEVA